MYSIAYWLVVFFFGAMVGAGSLALVRCGGFPAMAQLLAVMSNVAQAVSVIVAMCALLVTLKIGTDQNSQQKRQYTRDFLSNQMTPERAEAFNGVQFLLHGATILAMQPSLPPTFAEGVNRFGSSTMPGQTMSVQDLPRVLSERLEKVHSDYRTITSYLDSVAACLLSQTCEEAIARPTLCWNVWLMRDFMHAISFEGGLGTVLNDYYQRLPPESRTVGRLPQSSLLSYSPFVNAFAEICPALSPLPPRPVEVTTPEPPRTGRPRPPRNWLPAELR